MSFSVELMCFVVGAIWFEQRLRRPLGFAVRRGRWNNRDLLISPKFTRIFKLSSTWNSQTLTCSFGMSAAPITLRGQTSFHDCIFPPSARMIPFQQFSLGRLMPSSYLDQAQNFGRGGRMGRCSALTVALRISVRRCLGNCFYERPRWKSIRRKKSWSISAEIMCFLELVPVNLRPR